jgi:hypothetical protein
VLTRVWRERFRLANTEFLPSLSSDGSSARLFRIHKPAEAIEDFPRLRPLLRFRNILQLTGEDVGTAALTTLVAAPAKLVVMPTVDASLDALTEFARNRGVEARVRVHPGVALGDSRRLDCLIEEEFGSDGLEVVLDEASDDLAAGLHRFERLFPRISTGGSYLIERWSFDHFVLERLLAGADVDADELERMRVEAVRELLARKGAVLEAIVPALVEAVELRPEVVAAVTATKHWLEVRRGPAAVDPSNFRLSSG